MGPCSPLITAGRCCDDLQRMFFFFLYLDLHMNLLCLIDLHFVCYYK